MFKGDNGIKPNQFTNSPPVTKTFVRKDGKPYTIRDFKFRYFFPDEWMAFYDALGARQKFTFNFLINTGCRINEARNVRVGDIDFERNSIVIRVTKSRNTDGTKRMRVITISPEFAKTLKKNITFYSLKPEHTFNLLSTPAANIAMKKTLKKIGFKDWQIFSVHNVRKTLETWLLALNIDSLKVVKHFGHSYNVAARFYVSSDTFSFEDKRQMRMIIGSLLQQQERYG